VATHAIDMRWHGTYAANNPGEKVFFHCNSYEENVNDIQKFYQWIKARHPHLPLFVIAHSNGGLIALKYGLTLGQQSDISGFIVSSPWLKNKVKVPRIVLTLSKLIALINPTFSVTPASLIDVLTHDKNIKARHIEDELKGLRGAQASAKLGVESMKTQRWVIEHMDEWQKFPLFAVIAGDDALAEPATSEQTLNKVPKNLLKLVKHPQNYHENFNETNRDTTFNEIFNWMKAISGTR
jgi:alpha-beta hydrolase superfamily lysophospholipase